MDYFTKNKVLFWLVVFLVVVNTITLGAFWFGKGPGPMHRPQPNEDGQKIMEEMLGLDEKQALSIKNIRDEHFERSRPLHRQMHEIRLDIIDELFAAEPNEVIIEGLLAELNSLQGQFERNLFEHFKELKDVCTDEQAKELRFMLIDLIERTRPRGPEDHQRRPGEGFGPRPMNGEGPMRRPPPRR